VRRVSEGVRVSDRPVRRLCRSRRDRKIAGVCGGLAEHLGIDPILPRILWVVLALGGGVGILAYLVCWLVIPQEPAATTGPLG